MKVWKKVTGENRTYQIEKCQVLNPKRIMGDFSFTFILSNLKTYGGDEKCLQNFNRKN